MRGKLTEGLTSLSCSRRECASAPLGVRENFMETKRAGWVTPHGAASARGDELDFLKIVITLQVLWWNNLVWSSVSFLARVMLKSVTRL